jgi:hypothetical protein
VKSTPAPLPLCTASRKWAVFCFAGFAAMPAIAARPAKQTRRGEVHTFATDRRTIDSYVRAGAVHSVGQRDGSIWPRTSSTLPRSRKRRRPAISA